MLKPSTRGVVEGVVILVLTVSAFGYGRLAFLHTTNPASFYQSDFGPAVMLAAGHGFVNPVPLPGGSLDDFLATRRQTLSAVEAAGVGTAGFSQNQNAMRYLLYGVGTWWRIAGISWPAVAAVAGALHVLAALGTYALLRLFVPLGPAAAGAAWMCASTLQLSFISSIRDYSKGAFILAAMPLIVALALRATSRAALLVLAAAAGLVIGIGIGFKMDVAVMAPIVVAAIIVFRGRRPWTGLAEKAQAVAVFALVMLGASAPVLDSLSRGGSNAVHVVLLGYADPFDAGLDVQPSVYGFFPVYDDGYVAAAVRTHGRTWARRQVIMPSVEYDQASQALWFDILRHFPADSLTRALGAADAVLNLAFENPGPGVLTRPRAGDKMWTNFDRALHQGRGWGAALGALFLIAATSVSARTGLFAGFLLLTLAGYPSLQFQMRHYFHLQVIPLLALLTLLCGAVPMLRRVERPHLAPTATRLAGAAAIAALIVILPLALLRAYQARHFRHEVADYLSGPRTRVDAEFSTDGEHRVMARWPGAAGGERSSGQLAAAYLVEFRAERPSEPMVIGLRYRSKAAFNDFSRTLSLSSNAGIARFGFSVFGVPGEWEFEGIELDPGMQSRLLGIYRMADGPAGLPLDLTLPAEWSTLPLYQRLSFERHFGRPAVPPRLRAS